MAANGAEINVNGGVSGIGINANERVAAVGVEAGALSDSWSCSQDGRK